MQDKGDADIHDGREEKYHRRETFIGDQEFGEDAICGDKKAWKGEK